MSLREALTCPLSISHRVSECVRACARVHAGVAQSSEAESLLDFLSVASAPSPPLTRHVADVHAPTRTLEDTERREGSKTGGGWSGGGVCAGT